MDSGLSRKLQLEESKYQVLKFSKSIKSVVSQKLEKVGCSPFFEQGCVTLVAGSQKSLEEGVATISNILGKLKFAAQPLKNKSDLYRAISITESEAVRKKTEASIYPLINESSTRLYFASFKTPQKDLQVVLAQIWRQNHAFVYISQTKVSEYYHVFVAASKLVQAHFRRQPSEGAEIEASFNKPAALIHSRTIESMKAARSLVECYIDQLILLSFATTLNDKEKETIFSKLDYCSWRVVKGVLYLAADKKGFGRLIQEPLFYAVFIQQNSADLRLSLIQNRTFKNAADVVAIAHHHDLTIIKKESGVLVIELPRCDEYGARKALEPFFESLTELVAERVPECSVQEEKPASTFIDLTLPASPSDFNEVQTLLHKKLSILFKITGMHQAKEKFRSGERKALPGLFCLRSEENGDPDFSSPVLRPADFSLKTVHFLVVRSVKEGLVTADDILPLYLVNHNY